MPGFHAGPQTKTERGDIPGEKRNPGLSPGFFAGFMKLTITQDKRKFEVYLHFAVLEGDCLLAASFAGLQTAVGAVSASIVCGYEGKIVAGGETTPFYTRLTGYRRFQAPLNDELHHGLVLTKDAVFYEESPAPVILAHDGDIKTAVGKYLAARYGLPQEWVQKYPEMLDWDEDGDVKALTVIADKNTPWANLRAVRLEKHVDADFVHDKISKALKRRRLVVPPSPVSGQFDPNWTVNEYLKANAPVLAEQINKAGALFTPGKDGISPHFATMGRVSFPAQAFVTQATINALKAHKAVYVCGDMGTGKTQVANGVAHVLHKERGVKRVLVTAPGIAVPKWAKEIRTTVPYAKIRVLNSTGDALRLAREIKAGTEPEGLEFILSSIDRTKLGPDPFCSAIWKRVKGAKFFAWHCPECSRPLPSEDEYEEAKKNPGRTPGVFAGWSDLVNGLTKPPEEDAPKTPGGVPPGAVQWKRKSKIRRCPYCGARLWRPANKGRGETRLSPRWFICRVLKNLGKVFDLYVADEIHQTKAHDSGRGYAFGQLVKCAKKVVGLTGTLTTGKSTSIKEVLWRTDPSGQIQRGFGHGSALKWADRYGVLERSFSKDDVQYTDEGVLTVRRGRTERVRELPGISPELTATYLLDKAVFFELGDLGLPLVEITEAPVFVDLDPAHGEEYETFHNELHAVCAQAARAGAKGAFAAFIPATINYADLPHRGARVEVRDETVVAPAFPRDYYHAKERKLVEMVKEELAQGRGVFVYTRYSGAYGVNERIQEVLAAHGIESTVLTTAVGQEERLEWLEQEAQKGAKVIISNLELVEVSLDLIHWPTLIFYQLDYRVNDVRQAAKRAWRIGQTRECKIFYLVYDGTQQMNQFKHVMAGRGHAMFVEGRLDRSELARYALDQRTAVAYDIATCLAESDLAEKWTELAKKDIGQNLTLVSESEFLAVLEETKRKLTEETLRLCGAIAPAPEAVTAPEEEIAFAPEEEDGTLEFFAGVTECELFDPEKMELFPGWGYAEEAPVQTVKRSRKRKKKTCEGQLTLFDIA